jgi:hypothetical protein
MLYFLTSNYVSGSNSGALEAFNLGSDNYSMGDP